VALVAAGGLTSYGQDLEAADFMDKVLRAPKQAHLPVEQPMAFQFVINVMAAEGLGLAVPPELGNRRQNGSNELASAVWRSSPIGPPSTSTEPCRTYFCTLHRALKIPTAYSLVETSSTLAERTVGPLNQGVLRWHT
jgi:hypothetical protein